MKRHDPLRFGQIGTVLSCKDWLRFCLTGTVGTDFTEASTSFPEVQSQIFSPEILQVYGLDKLHMALPKVSLPQDVAGFVTKGASAVAGLSPGTPVVEGLHDVTAAALGIGGHGTGKIAVIAGTYSINESVSAAPGDMRLTGGISRSAAFVRLLADVLNLPVIATATDEAAAWGSALCAGGWCRALCQPRSRPPRSVKGVADGSARPAARVSHGNPLSSAL